jgi:hypothetical protein
VTCWHCVRTQLPDSQRYAAAIEVAEGEYGSVLLEDIQQDTNGTDLATARADLKPTLRFTLADSSAHQGHEVWTYGYPLTGVRQHPELEKQFELQARYLEGYVTRLFNYEDSEYGQAPSYELDMPAPGGLSGAPRLKKPSHEVVGVIYGDHDVGTIDQLARIDPATGERTPEVQRVVTFALAHFTETIKNLQGVATDSLPLAEYLKTELP